MQDAESRNQEREGAKQREKAPSCSQTQASSPLYAAYAHRGTTDHIHLWCCWCSTLA
jgi:hypothetical protein